MTAVPDPTVEALPRRDVTHQAVEALRLAAANLPVSRPGQSHALCADWLRRRADLFEETLTARAAAPDALRVAVEALAAVIERGHRRGDRRGECYGFETDLREALRTLLEG